MENVFLRSRPSQGFAEAGAVSFRSRANDKLIKLDGISQAIWDQLDYYTTVDDVADKLSARYDAPHEVIRSDIQKFVTRLDDHGLIEQTANPEFDRQRERYLGLIKQVLVNNIYPNAELQIAHLESGNANEDRMVRQRYLRDIESREPQNLEKLLSTKKDGRSLAQNAHTMSGTLRLNNIERCAERIFADGIEGDFLEAGVCQGGATILMRALQVSHQQSHRSLWAIDSFEGLPPSSESADDQRYGLDMEEEKQPWLSCSLAKVQTHFQRYDLLDPQVNFLKGFVADTLPDAPIGPLALMRLDVDLYSSTMECLNHLYHKLVPGGFVIIDDYGYLPGCRDAVDAFRNRHSITEPIEHVDFTGICWRKQN